jgi:hypothetical protein
MASQRVRDTANLDDAMRAYAQKLLKWRHAGQLAKHQVEKSALNDRSGDEQENDWMQHVVCGLAAVWADEAGVLTEHSFLNNNLSSILTAAVWELVQEARPYWRSTIIVNGVPAHY